MRKFILIACIILMPCALISSCKKDNAATEKIDFTKAYEEAASALTTAQKNFDLAVSSKDATKIASAAKALQAAQAKYEETKKSYVSNGGTINQQYESVLKSSQEAVKNSSVISSISAAKDSVSGVSSKVANVKHQAQKELNTKATETKAKIDAEKAKLKESTESAKKKVDENVDKAKDKLNKLLQ